VLVPYVLFVIYTATRSEIPRGAVTLIIIANALWAIASVAVLLSGWVAPNALGIAFVLAQAAVVALLGELQYVGLRRPLATA
jgi:glucose uptake protein GlcU